MYIDRQFTSVMGKQFCGKTFVLPVLHRSLGKIEKSFSPELPDYFIQEVRKINLSRQKKYCIFIISPRCSSYNKCTNQIEN